LRYFYVWMAILALLFVFIGFAKTYFIPLAGGTFKGRLLLHFHGAMFIMWLLLCIAQPLLVQFHKTSIHRKVGVFGFILAAMMVVMGVAVGITTAQLGNNTAAKAFLLIPLSDMVLFGTFTGVALWNRKNTQAHRRLIILSLLAILPAAFGRIFPMLGLSEFGFVDTVVAMLIQESILIIAILHDAITRKRVHPVYIWGGIALVLIHLFRFPLSNTKTWLSIAEFLTA
jgi:hypothetical protein